MVDKLTEGVRAWWPILLTTISIIATIGMTYGGVMQRLTGLEGQLAQAHAESQEAHKSALDATMRATIADARLEGLLRDIASMGHRQKVIEDLINRR